MCNAGPESGVRFLCSMMKRLAAVSEVVALKASELKPKEWRCPERSWPAATGWRLEGCGAGDWAMRLCRAAAGAREATAFRKERRWRGIG